jgi:hypothetical protein
MQVASGEIAGSINGVGLALTTVCGVALLVLPRRLAMLPVLLLVCYMTMGDRIVIAGLNFPMIRILLIFGWLRLVLRWELGKFNWIVTDAIIIAWAIMRTVDYSLMRDTSTAFVNRLGYAYNIVGCYFLFRCLLRNRNDVLQALRQLTILVGPLAVLMIIEKVTSRNAFAAFGGVPLIPDMRDGVLRCQGPFGHPILAGTFGATSLCLLTGMWWQNAQKRVLTIIGVISAIIITITAASSGPVLACAAGILALSLWPARKRMRVIRWSAVCILVVLQIVMSSPIWFVMARLTVFSGSTGWFRGFVIDKTIAHFQDWWLIGSSAAPQWHPFLMDITNQYVAEALDGGLISLILFVAIFTISFRKIGQVIRIRPTFMSLESKRFAWALGATLFAHMINFISISYFDQNFVMLYFLLAAIPAVSTLSSFSPSTMAPFRSHVISGNAVANLPPASGSLNHIVC